MESHDHPRGDVPRNGAVRPAGVCRPLTTNIFSEIELTFVHNAFAFGALKKGIEFHCKPLIMTLTTLFVAT